MNPTLFFGVRKKVNFLDAGSKELIVTHKKSVVVSVTGFWRGSLGGATNTLLSECVTRPQFSLSPGMSPRQVGNESHPIFWAKKKSKKKRRNG